MRSIPILVPLLLVLLAAPAFAIDGVREINQASVSGVVNVLHVISEPGSYRLTGDLVAPSGKNGISIRASNVTLDLNGFTLSSSSAPGSGLIRGIESADTHNIEIRNGTIRSFPSMGIYLVNGARDHRIIDIRALENGGDGIRIEGTTNAGSIVSGCTSSRNLQNGIYVLGANSLVTNNVAAANGNIGFQLALDVGYAGNVVGGNGGSQIVSGDPIGCNLIGGTTVCPP